MKRKQTLDIKDDKFVKPLSFDEANELLKKITPNDYTVSDLVLILLYAHPDKPIFGRLLFIKEVFLLTKEIIDKESIKVQDVCFVPYRYGPYSFVLGNVLSNLEFLGYILRTGPKNAKGESFSLTDKGKKVAAPLWDKLSDNIKLKIQDGRIGWDELGREGILRHVYQNYHEFTKNSYIKGRYKTISWGTDWVTENKKNSNTGIATNQQRTKFGVNNKNRGE
jgi:hypothetical protein